LRSHWYRRRGWLGLQGEILYLIETLARALAADARVLACLGFFAGIFLCKDIVRRRLSDWVGMMYTLSCDGGCL